VTRSFDAADVNTLPNTNAKPPPSMPLDFRLYKTRRRKEAYNPLTGSVQRYSGLQNLQYSLEFGQSKPEHYAPPRYSMQRSSYIYSSSCRTPEPQVKSPRAPSGRETCDTSYVSPYSIREIKRSRERTVEGPVTSLTPTQKTKACTLELKHVQARPKPQASIDKVFEGPLPSMHKHNS
jgi:hypothetical protein